MATIASILAAACLVALPAPVTDAATRTDKVARADIVAPRDLAKRLGKKDAPFIVHVGPSANFAISHIPGARDADLGSTPDGLERLKAAVKGLPKDREIVLYCGCCPWETCPNVHPGLAALKASGYKKVRALELPTDYTIDWAKRGYPVEKSKPRRE